MDKKENLQKIVNFSKNGGATLYIIQLLAFKLTFINIKSGISETLHKLDDLDLKLLYELTRDGSISVPNLSKKMGINASVLYSRIKRLTKKNIIKKFTVVVDEAQLGIGVKATIGINRDPKLKDAIHKQLLQTPEIVSISEVTGRFDIMVGVHAENLEKLHNIVIDKIGKIEGIQSTETFVELQKTDKEPSYLVSK
ncbi:Transcriptional regulator, AsnC family (Modular protein) [Candidatus Nitrosotenuis uzonensis]|uniref:Transcriptional regulator, AsnC family (Modular protein) n=1 Tax=Candidatus Nitrosotenuis uzonensis TaxID=1407055 RepID=A0A812EY33_9ARCH|nr:Transcriptional regulator, AsnC family (Modular protein) [Candidatus Nitrosotenuis uzonensis]